MRTNRLLDYHAPCRCCRAERLAQEWHDACEQLENAIGTDVAELIYPSFETFLNCPDDAHISVLLTRDADIAPITTLDGAGEQTAAELRRVGTLLIEAAERLEGGTDHV